MRRLRKRLRFRTSIFTCDGEVPVFVRGWRPFLQCLTVLLRNNPNFRWTIEFVKLC